MARSRRTYSWLILFIGFLQVHWVVSLAQGDNLYAPPPSRSPSGIVANDSSAEQWLHVSSGDHDDTALDIGINVDQDNQNVNFHMRGPMGNSWMAFGFGKDMSDAVMFIAYAAGGQNRVTLSPRTSTGFEEPSATSSLNVTTAMGTGVKGDYMVVCGTCFNCKNISQVELGSNHQQMLWAVGPEAHIADSPDAALRRHDAYGEFTMDLAMATGQGHLPRNIGNTTAGVSTQDESNDHDWNNSAHAAAMGLSFILLIPMGIVWLRIMEKPIWHAFNQGIAAFLILIGLALGIKLSKEYNRSKKFKSVHQIVGFIIVSAVAIQLLIGWMNHRRYMKRSQMDGLNAPRNKVMMVHTHLGQVILALGVVNGAIGIYFAQGITGDYLFYFGLVLLVAIVYVFLTWNKARRDRKKAARENPHNQGFEFDTSAHQQQHQQRPQYPYPAPGSVPSDGISSPNQTNSSNTHGSHMELNSLQDTSSSEHAPSAPPAYQAQPGYMGSFSTHQQRPQQQHPLTL